MGHKTRAREFATRHGWPVGHGTGVLAPEPASMLAAAEAIAALRHTSLEVRSLQDYYNS